MVEMKNNIRLEVTAGDTVAWNVKLNNITENLRLAYFTVKENPDDEPVIQKTLDAGITLVDNRAYRDQKTYKIQLQSEDTAGLSPDLQYLYDLKVAIGNVVKTIISGVFVVRESVTSPTLIIVDDAEVEAVDLVTAEFETVPATNGIEYEEDPVANAKIGNMADLNTEQKSTLVGAINEINTKSTNTQEDVTKILNGDLTVAKSTTSENAVKTDFTNSEWEHVQQQTYQLPEYGTYQIFAYGKFYIFDFTATSTGDRLFGCNANIDSNSGTTDHLKLWINQFKIIFDGNVIQIREVDVAYNLSTSPVTVASYYDDYVTEFYIRKLN